MSPRLRTLARIAPLTALALLAGCWLLAALERDDWWIAVLAVEMPVPLYLGAAVLAVVGGAVARCWWASSASGACLAIAVFPLGGWNVPSSSRQPTPYSVLTCNVEQWSHGGQVVGQAFSQLALDIMCLQEAVNYEHEPADPEWEAFRAELPGYELIRHGEIALATSWPVLQQQLVPLPEGPLGRPLLHVALRAPSGERLHTVVAHFAYSSYYGKPPGSLAAAARARRAQAQALLKHLATFDGPTIVCGDLNTAPNSVVMRLLRAELSDAWELWGSGFGFTVSSRWPKRRIDYLLVRGLEAGDVRVLDRELSDHRAVLAGFSVVDDHPTLRNLRSP